MEWMGQQWIDSSVTGICMLVVQNWAEGISLNTKDEQVFDAVRDYIDERPAGLTEEQAARALQPLVEAILSSP